MNLYQVDLKLARNIRTDLNGFWFRYFKLHLTQLTSDEFRRRDVMDDKKGIKLFYTESLVVEFFFICSG